MKMHVFKSAVLLVSGFALGCAVSLAPHASAAKPGDDLLQKHFMVSIDEIRQNFVFGDDFVGHYMKTVTLSDGSTRTIELTPMIHNGTQVVEFKDTGGYTYMALNGTTTNGTLMVELRDKDTMLAQQKAEGWR